MKQLYPGWRYHAELEPRLVRSQAEDEALGADWYDSPATAEAAAKLKAEAVVVDEELPVPCISLRTCLGPIVTADHGASYVCEGCGEKLSSASADEVRLRHMETPIEDRSPMTVPEEAADPEPEREQQSPLESQQQSPLLSRAFRRRRDGK